MTRSCVLVTLLLAAAVCVAQTGSAALLKADRDFAQAVAQKGLDGWMSFMADNSVRLGAPPVVGKEAIRAAMAESFAIPGFKLKWAPTRAAIFKGGNLGYTVGRYEATRANNRGETVTSSGSYLTVWQKQKDGSWKVVWDGGSPDPAPANSLKIAPRPKP